MSTRLLLDEVFHPRIATELTARGHDCLAVAAEANLRESSDVELLAHTLGDDRILVTNNVVDFERLPPPRRRRRGRTATDLHLRRRVPPRSAVHRPTDQRAR